MSDSLIVKKSQGVCYFTLNRPAKKNALDQHLMSQLLQQLDEIKNQSYRILVLTGAGNIFCAGADLQEMVNLATTATQVSEAPSENYQQAMQLALLLDRLDNLPLFTIARVNGPSFGGGLGLLCCCDMVIAEKNACFGFSELKLGLVPATIMPYVLKSISLRQARRYVLSTEIFDAQQAMQLGLVHQVSELNELDTFVEKQVRLVLKTKPKAFALAKQLIQKKYQLTEQQIRVSAHQLAQVRSQKEAIDGINAFFTAESTADSAADDVVEK